MNINGTVYDLNGSEIFTKFDANIVKNISVKESHKGFYVPLDVIRKITTSSKTWLRVKTTKGLIEYSVVDGNTDSKTYHASKSEHIYTFISQTAPRP
ncbi:MAG: hypothetical protein ACRC8Q_00220 [Aeromonas sp.]